MYSWVHSCTYKYKNINFLAWIAGNARQGKMYLWCSYEYINNCTCEHILRSFDRSILRRSSYFSHIMSVPRKIRFWAMTCGISATEPPECASLSTCRRKWHSYLRVPWLLNCKCHREPPEFSRGCRGSGFCGYRCYLRRASRHIAWSRTLWDVKNQFFVIVCWAQKWGRFRRLRSLCVVQNLFPVIL